MQKNNKRFRKVMAMLLVFSFLFETLCNTGMLFSSAQQETTAFQQGKEESVQTTEGKNNIVTTDSTQTTAKMPDKATDASASTAQTTSEAQSTSTTQSASTTQKSTTTKSASTTEEVKKIKEIEVEAAEGMSGIVYKTAVTTDSLKKALKVQIVYEDGSKKETQNYDIEYSDGAIETISAKMGEKKVTVVYHSGDIKYTKDYKINVVPDVVKNVIQFNATVDNFSLSWDKLEDVTGYQVIGLNKEKNTWSTVIKGSTKTLTITENNTTIKKGNQNLAIDAGGKYEVRVRAFYIDPDSKEVIYGEMSPIVKTVTLPLAPTTLSYVSSETDEVSLKWDKVTGADGYEVYRKASGDADYIFCNTSDVESFTDTGLTAGTTYYYKVRAYNTSRDYCGAYTASLKVSTLPKSTNAKAKAGDKRVRLTWDKVSGVTGYKIFLKKEGEEQYSEAATVEKSSTVIYTKTGLENDTEYMIQVRPYRLLDGVLYLADAGNTVKSTPVKVAATSKKAKRYKNLKQFKKSSSYQKITWFKKYVKYSKSYVMPGMINTNVGGFNSYNMCPQSITFAGKYLLMTAYDRAGEENSVIYVMSTSTKKLVTTLILPDKYHVGGIAYDGSNVWLSHGNSVAAIKYSTIASAAAKKKGYVNIDYCTVIKVRSAASYIAYFKGYLWVGVCYERGSQPLYSYKIGSKTGTPTLTAKDKKMMPSRVQGISFLKDGSMVLSRSNLFTKGAPYYIAQLEYYKPKWSGKKIKSLGKCLNVCQQPTMNEGISIKGNDLYVVYESPAFYSATYPMDRICAFSLTSVKKKK